MCVAAYRCKNISRLVPGVTVPLVALRSIRQLNAHRLRGCRGRDLAMPKPRRRPTGRGTVPSGRVHLFAGFTVRCRRIAMAEWSPKHDEDIRHVRNHSLGPLPRHLSCVCGVSTLTGTESPAPVRRSSAYGAMRRCIGFLTGDRPRHGALPANVRPLQASHCLQVVLRLLVIYIVP